ncbi:MAG TPA: hypothetical protein VJW76_08095 [Verrucomicrobiae bacterium]|nr:hypothetical protein [Verrucomicrobiae bacterium]
MKKIDSIEMERASFPDRTSPKATALAVVSLCCSLTPLAAPGPVADPKELPKFPPVAQRMP